MRQGTVLAAVILTALMASSVASAGDPPTLDRQTAAKILGFKDGKEVTVRAVVAGGLMGTNTAMVLYEGPTDIEKRDGRRADLYYDPQLGWFAYVLNDHHLYIWTAKGALPPTTATETPAR